ncbi:MAG: hypothetical protein EAZ66_01590 [Alphaproteobacteria bacterium]|nr:MAG: hypothetical protein EAZ66_01590 [Alphaproteobacteria bacterium]
MRTPNHHGYSLIELSVTLGFLALLAGSWLTFAASNSDKKNIERTEKKLDVIEDALHRFVSMYDRLPCPAGLAVINTDASFGLEDNCAAITPTLAGITRVHDGSTQEVWIGTIPTRTLGIKESYMIDGWGRRMTYAIHKRTGTISLGNPIQTFSTFTATNAAQRLRVENIHGHPLHNPTQLTGIQPDPHSTDPILYVLVSHGHDRRGSYNKTGILMNNCGNATLHRDIENCDYTIPATRDSLFLSSAIMDSRMASQYYYDILRWKIKSQFSDTP